MYLLFCVHIHMLFIGIVRSNSCIGVDSCINSSGRIGFSSCQAAGSCRYNSGEIENESCGNTEGDEDTVVRKNVIRYCKNSHPRSHNSFSIRKKACANNSGTIGSGSCQGAGACMGNTGKIGNGSCNADGACMNNNAGEKSYWLCTLLDTMVHTN